jgi:hypothetical protein
MAYARPALAGLGWLFVALVIVQVFWAGSALFAGGDFALHRDFGYMVSLVPLLILVAALPARAGRRMLGLAGLLFVVTLVQTILPILRDDAPFLAALHPVNALLVFWLGLAVARRATALARAPLQRTAGEPARAGATD